MTDSRTVATGPALRPDTAALRSARMERVCGEDPELRALLEAFVVVARAGLPRMLAVPGTFAHSLRLGPRGLQPAGTSLRYGAIVLLGLARSPGTAQAVTLGGATTHAFLEGLWASEPENLGDLALLAWAARELDHPLAKEILARLDEAWASTPNPFTVEAAWALAAHSAGGPDAIRRQRARAIADTLGAALAPGQRLFPHWVRPGRAAWHRRHLACFADQVYPIQALSMFHRTFGDGVALDLARRCAAAITELQGEHGQWWWHYDARNGRVIEGYPVYSVHQDAMAPMALLDHLEAGGDDHVEAIRRGVRWFRTSALEAGLIDEERAVIWRKVARNDPRKLVRGVKALGARLVPGLGLPGLDGLFPPRVIDRECRPYHLGWILRAWQA